MLSVWSAAAGEIWCFFQLSWGAPNFKEMYNTISINCIVFDSLWFEIIRIFAPKLIIYFCCYRTSIIDGCNDCQCQNGLVRCKVAPLSPILQDDCLQWQGTVFENHKKVSFTIASEASYVYILKRQKFIKNAISGPFLTIQKYGNIARFGTKFKN